jgi:hypothetical protein
MGVGAADALGVQGRYLLAGVPLAAWLLPARQPTDARQGLLASGAWIATVLFVVLTYLVVPMQIIARYYGS